MMTTTAPIDASVRQLADDAVTTTTNAPKSVAKQDDSLVVIPGDGQQLWRHEADPLDGVVGEDVPRHGVGVCPRCEF